MIITNVILAIDNVMADVRTSPVEPKELCTIPGVNYAPKRFSAAMIPLVVDGTRVSLSVYKKTTTSMGAKSPETAIKSIHEGIAKLRGGGVKVTLDGEPRVSNLTCTAYPEGDELRAELPAGQKVDHFKSGRFRDEDGVTFLIYKDPLKVVITGVTTTDQAARSLRRLFQLS